jgi:hypothetical protein
MKRLLANCGSIATPIMPACPSQKRSALAEEYPVVAPTPCSLLMVPEGSRTESPLHFSVKNMVPSFMNAMSQGDSILSTTSSVVTVGAAAKEPPDSARPTEAAIANLVI